MGVDLKIELNFVLWSGYGFVLKWGFSGFCVKCLNVEENENSGHGMLRFLVENVYSGY